MVRWRAETLRPSVHRCSSLVGCGNWIDVEPAALRLDRERTQRQGGLGETGARCEVVAPGVPGAGHEIAVAVAG